MIIKCISNSEKQSHFLLYGHTYKKNLAWQQLVYVYLILGVWIIVLTLYFIYNMYIIYITFIFISFISSSDKRGIRVVCFTASITNAFSFHYILQQLKDFKLCFFSIYHISF